MPASKEAEGALAGCRLAGRHRLDSKEERPGLRTLGRLDPNLVLQSGHPPREVRTGLDEHMLNEWQYPPYLGFLKTRHGQCVTLKGHLQGIT